MVQPLSLSLSHKHPGAGGGGAAARRGEHKTLLPHHGPISSSSSPSSSINHHASDGGADDGGGGGDVDYAREGVVDIARTRTGWLLAFCVGLLLAAVVVEQFEDVLEHHVELSFFVPLIMGHGGNTGSQSVTTVIRALALRQVSSSRDLLRVVAKEAGAGALMGAMLGLAILAFTCFWPHLSTRVGMTVAIALPLVSLWANGLGALITLLAERLGFDPAITAVPLMTTCVDSTGLVLYFIIAKLLLGIGGPSGAAAIGSPAAGGGAAAAAGLKVGTAAGGVGGVG